MIPAAGFAYPTFNAYSMTRDASASIREDGDVIGRSPLRDSREKLRRILEEIPWTFEAGVGAREIAEATGYVSQSVAMQIRNHLQGVEVESMQSGTRKIYKRIARYS